MSRGVLERLILEIGRPNFERPTLVQNLERPLCFNITARVHCQRGLTVEHSPLKKLHGLLVAMTSGVLKQGAKIFSQLGPNTLPRYELGLAKFLRGGKLHPIRRKSVLHQARAERFGGGVVREYGYEYGAHGGDDRPLPGLPASATREVACRTGPNSTPAQYYRAVDAFRFFWCDGL
jgi:hypothetical protein